MTWPGKLGGDGDWSQDKQRDCLSAKRWQQLALQGTSSTLDDTSEHCCQRWYDVGMT